jgi:hypothetical protein
VPLPRQAPPARRDSPRCPLTRINPSRPPTVVWGPASWDDVVPPLVASNLIREADYPMLEAMVGFVCRARQARDMLNDQPLMLRGREEGMVVTRFPHRSATAGRPLRRSRLSSG